MLPAIGLMVAATGGMIGFYIITRMAEIFQSEDASTGVEIFAVITVLVALAGMALLVLMSIDLVTAATSTAESLQDLSY